MFAAARRGIASMMTREQARTSSPRMPYRCDEVHALCATSQLPDAARAIIMPKSEVT